MHYLANDIVFRVCVCTENVQTNVVVVWLEKLASELEDRGQIREAASCIRKAMHYFGAEKGGALAQVMLHGQLETLLLCTTRVAARSAEALLSS
jgi:hypothetical protein